jgi:peptidoglycan L-alanyl-D-glutamate endopeptidase CwlK
MDLNERSLGMLDSIHEDLAAVVRHAAELSPLDFIVTEGLRTIARQKQLVAQGASRTMRSRHLTGHAVDLAAVLDGEVRWDWPLYGKLADAMKAAAEDLQIPIEWGGDWRSFRDGPHFQLPFSDYPVC